LYRLGRQKAYIGQISVPFPVIETVPHYKAIRKIKSNVLERQVDQPTMGFIE
jgi:hypothetical protein